MAHHPGDDQQVELGKRLMSDEALRPLAGALTSRNFPDFDGARKLMKAAWNEATGHSFSLPDDQQVEREAHQLGKYPDGDADPRAMAAAVAEVLSEKQPIPRHPVGGDEEAVAAVTEILHEAPVLNKDLHPELMAKRVERILTALQPPDPEAGLPQDEHQWVRLDRHLNLLDEARADERKRGEEELRAAMCIEETDSSEVLEAVRASVAWVNGPPHLDELQHAIGTFLAASLSSEGEAK